MTEIKFKDLSSGLRLSIILLWILSILTAWITIPFFIGLAVGSS